MNKSAVLKQSGSTLLAVMLIAWVLWQAEPAQIWEQFKRASWIGLLAAAVLNLGHNLFRVWRWRALLEPVRVGVPFRPMFSAVILGYMTSWIIPGRLGELVRPALLAGRENLPLGPCLGSVVADRLLDGLAVLALLAVGLVVAPLGGEAATHLPLLRTAPIIMVALIGVVVMILLAASSLEVRLGRLAGRRGLLGWIVRSVLAVSRGTQAFKRPRLLLRVLVHTTLAWLVISLATWVGIWASGAMISLWDVMILMPLLVLGIAVPTPGGAGSYHAVMTFGLTRLFGVDASVAAGAGFLMHAIVVVPVILLGLILLFIDRLPFADLLQAARQVRNLGATPAEHPS
jgi:uncharacterized protein (TIRG00374 family)